MKKLIIVKIAFLLENKMFLNFIFELVGESLLSNEYVLILTIFIPFFKKVNIDKKKQRNTKGFAKINESERRSFV